MKNIVYSNEGVKLVRHSKSEWKLTVEWEGGKKRFWVNFPFPLLKIIKQDNLPDDKREFTIKADSIKPLSVFLKEKKHRVSYEDAIEFLYDIGNQIQTLERFYMGIPFIEIKDIIVVDNRHFFYLNDEKLLAINSEQIEIIEPYHPRPQFISPEFNEIKSLPANISYKSGFYSLALIVGYALLNDYIDDENKANILAPIKATKLYWALMRMLEVDPADRFYLII